ncbi:MAG: hypothetical protein R3248_03190, partial [Candidatus Promineifilaceae bacterium]|nr:hypothetical protein [Candidatus Promineifilaceae bacterium]
EVAAAPTAEEAAPSEGEEEGETASEGVGFSLCSAPFLGIGLIGLTLVTGRRKRQTAGRSQKR